MAWFYSPQNGVGNQFSYKHGGREELTRESFRSYEVRPGIRYVVHVEARPRLDAQGRPAGYHQRMKWWAKGEPIPEEWIELDCGEGDPLRVAEYGVAIIAHRCKVDFGRVTVRALLNSEFRSQNSE